MIFRHLLVGGGDGLDFSRDPFQVPAGDCDVELVIANAV
jgi:hypothetical protein